MFYFNRLGEDAEQLRYVPAEYKSAKYLGFLLHKLVTPQLESRSEMQLWPLTEVLSGLKEGSGVFAKVDIKPHVIVCNYGGKILSRDFVVKQLYPYPEKCAYLLEFDEVKFGKQFLMYANHDNTSKETVGKYVNHSKRHANLIAKMLILPNGIPDVFFVTKCFVTKGTQLIWDYGNSYGGVADCVENCVKCIDKFMKSKFNQSYGKLLL